MIFNGFVCQKLELYHAKRLEVIFSLFKKTRKYARALQREKKLSNIHENNDINSIYLFIVYLFYKNSKI